MKTLPQLVDQLQKLMSDKKVSTAPGVSLSKHDSTSNTLTVVNKEWSECHSHPMIIIRKGSIICYTDHNMYSAWATFSKDTSIDDQEVHDIVVAQLQDAIKKLIMEPAAKKNKAVAPIYFDETDVQGTIDFKRDKLVFATDMFEPVDAKDIPEQGWCEPYAIIKDGEFDIEIDNMYTLMPKFIWLAKSGTNIVVSERSWGNKENIAKDKLEGLHKLKEGLDPLVYETVSTFYECEDEDTYEHVSIVAGGPTMKVATTNVREDAVIRMLSNPNIELECDKILALMQREQDFLVKKENMPFLAYLMLRWQNLYYAGRICFGYRGCLDIATLGQCENNPKYEFEGMENSDENENIIYDAWGAGISMESILPAEWLEQFIGLGERQPQFNEKDFDDLAKYYNDDSDFNKLLYKKNKTMDEWYELLGNPLYRYHSLYKTKHRIDDHLLCCIGNGYGWNKDGYITNDGPSGEDEADYGKFPMLKGHSTGKLAEIEAELNEILQQPHVQRTLDLSREWHINASVKRVREEVLSRGSGVGSLAITFVYNDGPAKKKDPKEVALKLEANARGFDNTEIIMIKPLNVTEPEKPRDIDPKKVMPIGTYVYDSKFDMLYHEAKDGGKWPIYIRGVWANIVTEDGTVVEPDPKQMEDLADTIALYERVATREDDTHPIFVETVAEAWSTFTPEERIEIKEAREKRQVIADEKEAKRIAAGGKPWKEMTMKEKLARHDKKEKKTKEEKKLDKIVDSAINKLEKLAEEKLADLTNEQIIEIKKHQSKSLDAFIAREDREEKVGGKYYPLSRSSAIMKMPKNVHPSYIDAGLRIMESILENETELTEAEGKNDKGRTKGNVKYAKQWLAEHGPDKYKKFAEKVVDYEAIFQTYLPNLESTKDVFEYVEGRLNINGAPGAGKANFYRVDKNEDDYSEHMVIGYWNIEGLDFPKVFGDKIELLEGTPLFEPLRKIMSTAIQVNRVAKFKITVDNVMNHEVKLTIDFEHGDWSDPDASNFAWQVDKRFREQGFLLGENAMVLELDNHILVTSRAKTLGLNHPNNESKQEFFSNSQYFDVYDKEWKKLGSFNIDERGFNTFSVRNCKDKELAAWLVDGHKEFKASNEAYGNYDSDNRGSTSEGKKNLYAHDFMMWLKAHQLKMLKYER